MAELVTDIAKYVDIVEAGEMVSEHIVIVTEGTVITRLYRFEGGLYSVTHFNEIVTFCERLT